MDKLFIPPMDREDIHILTTELGKVADIFGGTARRVVSLRATTRHEPAVALARTIVRAAQEIEAGVTRIKNGDEVLAHCRAIKRAEEEGDRVWAAAVTDLFSGRVQ